MNRVRRIRHDDATIRHATTSSATPRRTNSVAKCGRSDSTALKANIHFPTDWILLRDAVRTLMKAALLIRREGLRRRMEAPEAFLARMNTLSLQMSQAARRAGSKKARKRVLGQRQLFLPGGEK